MVLGFDLGWVLAHLRLRFRCEKKPWRQPRNGLFAESAGSVPLRGYTVVPTLCCQRDFRLPHRLQVGMFQRVFCRPVGMMVLVEIGRGDADARWLQSIKRADDSGGSCTRDMGIDHGGIQIRMPQ